jgi:hypothetical protein
MNHRRLTRSAALSLALAALAAPTAAAQQDLRSPIRATRPRDTRHHLRPSSSLRTVRTSEAPMLATRPRAAAASTPPR